MMSSISKSKTSLAYRVLCSFIAFSVVFTAVIPPSYAQSYVSLPAPGTFVNITNSFTPTIVKGITIHPENPLEFDFIVDSGDNKLKGEQLKEESLKLIKYFLATLTVPENELWVNLNPSQPDKIMPEKLGHTEMGRDLLAQDYILKQLTASLMHPEGETGKEFWNKIYKRTKKEFGTTDINTDTLNRVWIVPSSATVYEKDNSAFVLESELKVLLDKEYLSTKEGTALDNSTTTQIIKEIIIPELEREVNTGKNFALLRQISNSMILATWFKMNLKESLLGKVYVDQNKVTGIDLENKNVKQEIYNQYLEAFKTGVYNYIKEEYNSETQEIIPKKYFSGGMETKWSPKINVVNEDTADSALLAQAADVAGSVSNLKVNLYDFGADADLDQAMVASKKFIGATEYTTVEGELSSIPASAPIDNPWPQVVSKPTGIAISGIGRIGRLLVRQITDYNNPNTEIKAIIGTDVSRETTQEGKLNLQLKYAKQITERLAIDTAYGEFNAELDYGVDENSDVYITVNDKKIPIVNREKTSDLYKWSDLGVDVVVEASGALKDKKKAGGHLTAGAKRVLIAAPGGSDVTGTFVVGVNEGEFDPRNPEHDIVSNASCTTNAIAPVMQVLGNIGFQAGSLNSTHAVTKSQVLLDGTNLKKPEQGRSALKNIIKTSTGASKALKALGRKLWSRMSGSAYRVPTLTGSVITLDFKVDDKNMTKEQMLEAFKTAAAGELKGVIAVDGSLSTRDIIGRTEGAIVAEQSVKVINTNDGSLVHMQIWYDNEYGYTTQLLKMLDEMSEKIEKVENGEEIEVTENIDAAIPAVLTADQIDAPEIPELLTQIREAQKDLNRPIRLGVNGPGRIGRLIVRQLIGNPNFDLRSIPYDSPSVLARLLKDDTVHGKIKGKIEFNDAERWLSVNGKKIAIPKRVRTPQETKWEDYDVEMVIDVTGKFTTQEDLSGHLGQTVKKVIIGAPAKGDIEGTFVFGVNENTYDGATQNVISNASCTTNALVPVVKTIKDVFGIKAGFMTTVHAVTLSQPSLDSKQKKPDREPASGANITLTSTGAAKAAGLVLPDVKGLLDGDALRVPVEDGSMIKLSIETEKPVKDVDTLNNVLAQAADGYLNGILKVEEMEVSSQVIGQRLGAVVAKQGTAVEQLPNGGSLITLHIFYDNEAGYTSQLLRMAQHVGEGMVGVADQAMVASTDKMTLEDIDDAVYNGNPVMIRVDFNVPLDENGKITDDTRIRAAIPTIKYALSKNAKVIIASHMGRPKGERVKNLSLAPIRERLKELLKDSADFVHFSDEFMTAADAEDFIDNVMDSKQVLLLENTRFNEGEQSKDPEIRQAFADKMFKGIKAFILDGFSVAHRAETSVVMAPNDIPKAAGFLVAEEINGLQKIVNEVDLVVMGGSKVSGKINIIENLLKKETLKHVLIGGAMANAFLVAKGMKLAKGNAGIAPEEVKIAKKLLNSKNADKIILPLDVVVAKSFSKDAEYMTINVSEDAGKYAVKQILEPDAWLSPTFVDTGSGMTLIEPSIQSPEFLKDWIAVDIGFATSAYYSSLIEEGKVMFWNGPMGAFDKFLFAQTGTRAIARSLEKAKGFTGAGGGDSVAAINQFGIKGIDYISKAGGATLEFLEGKDLPGIVALSDKADQAMTTRNLSTPLSKAIFEARVAHDSRGRETVEVEMAIPAIIAPVTLTLKTTGIVPAGASKGKAEAVTVGVEQAIKNINEVITPALQKSGLNMNKHKDLIKADRLIAKLAGDNFKDLGADATVPVSWALWRMAAESQDMSLGEYIKKYEPDAYDNANDRVNFYMNIYNGGLHALKDGETLGVDRIDTQETMLVIKAATYQEAIEMGDKIDAELKLILLGEFEIETITRADEAGFSVKGLGDSDKAIELVLEAIEEAGYTPGKDVKLALDVAASSFYIEKTGMYDFQGEMRTSEWMVDYYVGLAKKYPGVFISIEDGLEEDGWEAWASHAKTMQEQKVETIGDDLFVTQKTRFQKGIEEKSASAILIKVNQNGTMTGTLDVIKMAKENELKWVVSHRSGETMDAGIADLAYGTNAFGLKTGDPQPNYDFGEGGQYEGKDLVRRAKYQRMVELEKAANDKAMVAEINNLLSQSDISTNGRVGLTLAFGRRVFSLYSEKLGKTLHVKTIGANNEIEWATIVKGNKLNEEYTYNMEKNDGATEVSEDVYPLIKTSLIALNLVADQAMVANTASELINNISSYITYNKNTNAFEVTDINKLLNEGIDYLVNESALSKNIIVKKAAAQIIMEVGELIGIHSSSMHDVYAARRRGEILQKSTIPANNIRGMAYDTAKTAFEVMIDNNASGIFELARSERGYTKQPLWEYSASIYAAAIKTGYRGKIFLQLDHAQIDKKLYFGFGGKEANPEKAIQDIKDLINEAVSARVYNIDIDASSLMIAGNLKKNNATHKEAISLKLDNLTELSGNDLVALDAKKILARQTFNIRETVNLTKYIRDLEKKLNIPVTIAIGGEDMHVDQDVYSTEHSVEVFCQGLEKALIEAGIKKGKGVIKISVQSGTGHGGITIAGVPVGEAAIQINLTDLKAITEMAQRGELGSTIAGVVQHGASTVPEKFFAEFVKHLVIEVHLATGYQNQQLRAIRENDPSLYQLLNVSMVDVASGLWIKEDGTSGEIITNMIKYLKYYYKKAYGKAAKDTELASILKKAINIVEGQKNWAKFSEDIIKEVGELEEGKLNKDIDQIARFAIAEAFYRSYKKVFGLEKHALWNMRSDLKKAIADALKKNFSSIWVPLGFNNIKGDVDKAAKIIPLYPKQRSIELKQAMVAANITLHDGFTKKKARAYINKITLMFTVHGQEFKDTIFFDQKIDGRGYFLGFAEILDDRRTLVFENKFTAILPQTLEEYGNISDNTRKIKNYLSTSIANIKDQAMITPGGIDLNPAYLDMQIKRDGAGIPLSLDMQSIETMRIEGFIPVIINITPINNFPMLLGMRNTADDEGEKETQKLSSAKELEPMDKAHALI
ncbi:MAG: phosphoglycerate kinase [Candidatus Zapsychrus exili]|nr:phosphoglycerate kinase [Candidatus Zapsychrus exili]